MSEIFKKIPLVMAEIGAIGKTRNNPQQGYKFRGIDEVYNAVNHALAKHEVFCAPTVLKMAREERQTKSGGTLLYTILDVKYTFYAADGSSFECVTVGEAMDSGDKSCNKAMSAAQKYAFFQVFSIPTEEPKDSEDETHTLKGKGGKEPRPEPEPVPATYAELEVAVLSVATLQMLKEHWLKWQPALKALTEQERKDLEVVKDRMKELIPVCKKEGKACKRALIGSTPDEVGCDITMKNCPHK